MRRAGWTALAMLVFLVAFGVGLARNFPGDAAARALIAPWAASPHFAISLEPLRLGFGGIASPRLTVAGAAPGGKSWLELTHLRIPWLAPFWRGIPLRASLGGTGGIAGFFPWGGGDIVIESATSRLEDLPALAVLTGASWRGNVSLSGTMARPVPARLGARAELPAGLLRLQGERIEIVGLNTAGFALPATRLEAWEMEVRTGRVLQIERLSLRGDIQGTLSGTMTPVLERPRDSRLQLAIAGAVRPEWLQQTGPLRPILEGFLPGGRMDGTLEGTMGAPVWTRKGNR